MTQKTMTNLERREPVDLRQVRADTRLLEALLRYADEFSLTRIELERAQVKAGRRLLSHAVWAMADELEQLRAERQRLLADALSVEPCHITGMHDPEHHTRYMCQDQRASMLDRVLAVLGLTVGELPRRLHERCGWCHDVPNQEEYRQRLRETYIWAGLEIPPDLAEPAPDAPRPGDTWVVLAHITIDWHYWPDVIKGIKEAASLHPGRVNAAYRELLAVGAIEERRTKPGYPEVRLAHTVKAGRDATHTLLDINEVNEDDYEAVCACGWSESGLPDRDSAIDAHATHAEDPTTGDATSVGDQDLPGGPGRLPGGPGGPTLKEGTIE